MLARSLAALAALALGLSPGIAGAESGVDLPYPPTFDVLEAATYDLEGVRVGGATLVVEQLDDDNVRMHLRTGFAQGAHSVLSAELLPQEGRDALRPLWQESRSFDVDGAPIGVLHIDHAARIGTCRNLSKPDQPLETLELPPNDQVVNVPLNLLFLPLARGEKDSVSFQFFLCGGGPKLLDFQAEVATRVGGGRGLVEIRYGPDFGTFGSFLLAPVMPRLSIWFDPGQPQPWLGHRVPLYAKGPEVLVVRNGVPPRWLRMRP